MWRIRLSPKILFSYARESGGLLDLQYVRESSLLDALACAVGRKICLVVTYPLLLREPTILPGIQDLTTNIRTCCRICETSLETGKPVLLLVNKAGWAAKVDQLDACKVLERRVVDGVRSAARIATFA